MSSASDVTPRLPRLRSYAQTLPKGRPIMMLEWNKLFAEATEKDTQEGVDFKTANDDDCECDYEDETVSEEDEENRNSEMPLNLCHKANTVPNMSTRFDNTENSLDLSTEKKSVGNCSKGHELGKQNSCTVPNIQSNNYQDFLLTKKDHCDSNKPAGKQLFDKRGENENENMGISKVINNGHNPCMSYSNRTPMKEVNNLGQNFTSEKKRSVGVDHVQNFVDTSLKGHSVNKSSNSLAQDSQRAQENNVKNADHKSEKTKRSHDSDQPGGDVQKQNSGPVSQAKERVRFAVPEVPAKVQNIGKTIIVNGKSYHILAPLGKGGSSSVYLVLNSKNELLAVKCVKLSGVSESIKNDYLNEIQHLMRMQDSKHVIRLYDHQYIESHKLLYAVMEKGDTDLSRFLKDKAASEEGITPELIMYYWNEMLLAVKSIHDNNIIHRDLKPANFLLVSGRLKLIDFGIASSIQNEQTSILMDTQSGTFNYMSPEALLDLGSGNEIVLKIGRKSDVWSLGCILYYFLYKKTPYQDIVKPLQKMRAITDPNYTVKFPKLPGVPDILIESCKRCLVHDRKKRASIEELLEMKNRPLLTVSQVLVTLRNTLDEENYAKAEKALIREVTDEN